MGFAELFKFIQTAPSEKIREFSKLLGQDKFDSAVKMLEDHQKIKFHPSIYGKQLRQLLPSHKDPKKRRWMHVIVNND
jgi:hypothetical protein